RTTGRARRCPTARARPPERRPGTCAPGRTSRGSGCVRWCCCSCCSFGGLLVGWSSKELAEAIQAPLGWQPLATDPLGGWRQRLWCQLVGANAADLGRANKAGVFQHAEVLDQAGERHVEGTRQLGDGGGSADEALEQGAAGGVRQRVEHAAELADVI